MEELVKIILQSGLAGAIIAWFMFRYEPRMARVEEATLCVAKALTLQVLNDAANETIAEQARQLHDEIDAAQKGKKT